jgi:hypothetical protein
MTKEIDPDYIRVRNTAAVLQRKGVDIRAVLRKKHIRAVGAFDEPLSELVEVTGRVTEIRSKDDAVLLSFYLPNHGVVTVILQEHDDLRYARRDFLLSYTGKQFETEPIK